jgi:hypothetical protein
MDRETESKKSQILRAKRARMTSHEPSEVRLLMGHNTRLAGRNSCYARGDNGAVRKGEKIKFRSRANLMAERGRGYRDGGPL